jgi:transaldolase
MQIWLDSARLEPIQKAAQMGLLYGVTTNPSIVSKSQMSLEDLLGKILQIQKGPVTAQVTAKEGAEMVRQAEALFQFSPRIMVKIPVTVEGLKAIRALSPKVPTMATAVYDLNQVLLAATAGASYIAPYYSRICEADIDGIEVIRSMLHLLERYKFSSKLIGASLSSCEQVKELALMGAHAVTLKEDVFESFIQDNPLTLEALSRFDSDWKRAISSSLNGF